MNLSLSSESVSGRLLAVALLAVLSFSAGWKVNGWRQETALSDLEKTWAQTAAKTAGDHARRLAAANVRGDELALQLAERENALNTLTEEKNNEITRLTTGRRCLDAPVVRVLNRDRAGGASARVVPEAAGGVVRADGAAAGGADDRRVESGPGDGRFATDADVAGWIATCQARYDVCRGRLDGIRRFYADSENTGGNDE